MGKQEGKGRQEDSCPPTCSKVGFKEGFERRGIKKMLEKAGPRIQSTKEERLIHLQMVESGGDGTAEVTGSDLRSWVGAGSQVH